MSFLGATINSNQSVAGRAAVYVGATTSSFDALPTAMYSVGACDGTVSISPNQDIVKLQRSDGQNPYAVLETAYDFQATFNLQEVDIFNLALACGYNVLDEPSAAATTGYSSDTSGHHGILHSRSAQFTGKTGPSSIASIVIAGGNDDDGGGRDHKLIWNAKGVDDQSWQNTSRFADLKFVEVEFPVSSKGKLATRWGCLKKKL